MENFMSVTSPASTVEFIEGDRSAVSSFKSFNLYDTNIFATFFYSDIEKVWLMVVKSGMVKVNGKEIRSSVILCNICIIKFDTVEVQFRNVRDEIGLSQHLVERLLTSNDGQITRNKILEFIDESIGDAMILDCLKANKLFTEEGDFWRIDYRNYIDFLEGRTDPLHNVVLREVGSKSMSVGHSRTFNINVIWSNAYFSGGHIFQNTCGAVDAAIGQPKGVPNWPHSAHPPSFLNHHCATTVNTNSELSFPVYSASQEHLNGLQPSVESLFKNNSAPTPESCAFTNEGPALINNIGKTFNQIDNSSSMVDSSTSDTQITVATVGKYKYGDANSADSISSNFSTSQVESKTTKVKNLFTRFAIKGNHAHRKCYSVADGSNYLEGYRIGDGNAVESVDEDVKGYFEKLKSSQTVENDSENKLLKCMVSINGAMPPVFPALRKTSQASPEQEECTVSFGISSAYKEFKMDFVENYLVDFTSNESTSISDTRISEVSSSSASEPKTADLFAFVYGNRQYVPRKRKSILFPVKRYKFYFMPEFSPKIHDLPNYYSGVVVTSEYHSDGENFLDDPEPLSRGRCHSKAEPRSFTGRDYDYDLISLVKIKRKLKKHISQGSPIRLWNV